jgi:hypothetical protein
VISLVRELEGTDLDGAVAIMEGDATKVDHKKLSKLSPGAGVPHKRGGVDYDPSVVFRPEVFAPGEARWPRFFRPLPPEGNEYSRSRGIPNGAATWFRLGECFSGWLADRLVFPIFFQDKLIYWVARDQTGLAEKKILNMPNKPGMAGSGDVLLNMDRAGLVNGGRVVLVEGPVDAAVVGPDAVASLGKNLSRNQIVRMVEYGYTHVTVCYDGDVRKTAMDTAKRISAYIPASVAELPGKDDPAELGFEVVRTYINAAKPVQSLIYSVPSLTG